MSDLSRRVEELRRPLRELARDNFAALGGTVARGVELRRACDRVAELAPEDRSEELGAWRKRLDGFDALERDLQAVEVARGLRLCQLLGGPGPRTVARAPSHKEGTEVLPGIGPALAARLAERGVETPLDLVWMIPRRYDDSRLVEPLERVLPSTPDGERVAVRGLVHSCRFVRRGARRWVDLRLIGDEAGAPALVVRWFNARGPMADRFPARARVALSGVVRRRSGQAEMANPDVLEVLPPRDDGGDGDGAAADTGAGRIIARYPDVPGVPPATLRRACSAALAHAGPRLLDPVPLAVSERVGLPPLREALEHLHQPPPALATEELCELNLGKSAWHRRLAFGELFGLGVIVAQRRLARRGGQAPPCPAKRGLDAELTAALPFALTGAQKRAVKSLRADLAAGVPMNRLLQGDVGSGKTAVLFAAAHQVARAGRQVALMTPTEILAEQHHQTLGAWSRALGLRCALLTASQPSGMRASTLSLLASGQIDLLIGTHALLSEGVAFADLGLAVVDEQHRFGVAQRVRLRDKGQVGMPHLLVTTATPIPRTLALTAYGDLDVTILDEMPPGRTPVRTQVLFGAPGRRKAYDFLCERLAAGERAYVVCPLVEPGVDDGKEAADATSVAEKMARALEPLGYQVALVHGRLPSADRAAAVDSFRTGAAQVLVATTVIEVGVDVPQATLMIVQDADRFGLAQLHQLRGRVGRGGGESHCLLLSRGGETATGTKRLAVMAATHDGFRIADEDLALRGPGELIGARQAGLPRLRFGDLVQHTELLLRARAEAERLLDEDPALERHPALRAYLQEQIAEAEAYGAEGG